MKKQEISEFIDFVKKELPEQTSSGPIYEWSTDEFNKIIDVGRAMWKSLSDEEKSVYDEVGGYEFCEEILELLNMPISQNKIQVQIAYDLMLHLDPSELFR